jgi:hypothetical protein
MLDEIGMLDRKVGRLEDLPELEADGHQVGL